MIKEKIIIKSDRSGNFSIIEVIEVDNDIVKCTCIANGKLNNETYKEFNLRKCISLIHDKEIKYLYKELEYPNFDMSNKVKIKIDKLIRQYKIYTELQKLNNIFNSNIYEIENIYREWNMIK